MVGVSALIIALWPQYVPVSAALMFQAITGGFLGPGIAAISLGLVGHHLLPERLGRNQRFSSTGSLIGWPLIRIGSPASSPSLSGFSARNDP